MRVHRGTAPDRGSELRYGGSPGNSLLEALGVIVFAGVKFLLGDVMSKLIDAVRKSSFVCGLALAMIVPVASARAAEFKVLHSFHGGSDGEYPEAGLATDGSGTLYGTTFGDLGQGGPGKVCSKTCGNVYSYVDGVGLNTEYFFQAGADGAFPAGELFVQSGIIYGTTEYGGATACGGPGCGTAFLLPTGGGTNNVLKLCASKFPSCAKGAFPHAGAIVDSKGNAFGTTSLGGRGNGSLCGSNFSGCGVVYMLQPNLAEKVLYSFCSKPRCKDGGVPLGRLLMDSAGDLYGTTQFGGEYSQGTVFELQLANGSYSYKVLYSFCQNNVANCPDGAVPEAGLIADASSNFYGTTTFGGGSDCYGNPGCGVIFKLTQSGGVWTESVLHGFQGGASDGMFPESPLVADGAGNLYGTTLKGGGGQYCIQVRSCGTVFRLASDGTVKVIYAFGSQVKGADGVQPEGALLWQDPYLYGVTRVQGDPTCQCGILYRINTQQ